jgi:hypothetical protein
MAGWLKKLREDASIGEQGSVHMRKNTLRDRWCAGQGLEGSTDVTVKFVIRPSLTVPSMETVRYSVSVA